MSDLDDLDEIADLVAPCSRAPLTAKKAEFYRRRFVEVHANAEQSSRSPLARGKRSRRMRKVKVSLAAHA